MRIFFASLLLVIPIFVPVTAQAQSELDQSGYDLEDVMDIVYEDIADDPEVVEPITFDEDEYDQVLSPEDLPRNEYMRGKILEIVDEGIREEYEGYVERYQSLRVLLTSGEEKGKELVIENSGIDTIDTINYFSTGDRIVVVRVPDIQGGFNYFLADAYRLNTLFIIFGIFILFVLWLARLKGVGSLFGLGFSILVLSLYIVPQITQGSNPIVVTLIGSVVIIVVSLYLAHGFNHRTTLSLFSTFITLAISLGMASLFVHAAALIGLGSEEAFYIQTTQFGQINLQGLLLAGILIGTLGVLDDITTAQTAVVGELRFANKDLSKKELYKRALVVGKEHISSLVNTLVLAYAGASLPLFLLFSQNVSEVPFWYTLNSEFIAEEVVRTLVGSLSLIIAVPIASYIAAHFISKKDVETIHKASHVHHHH